VSYEWGDPIRVGALMAEGVIRILNVSNPPPSRSPSGGMVRLCDLRNIAQLSDFVWFDLLPIP